ncbi:MAG: hypothetical protein LBU82_01650 [Treponema sp.]|nr:hypothetical protein [Treponema sp.]
MKKIIAVLVVFALFAGAAFGGDIADGMYFNAWNKGTFVPLKYVTAPQVDGKTNDGAEGEAFTGGGVSWGGARVRAGFNVGADSEMVGWKAELHAEDMGVGDWAYVYAKPFGSDILKLSMGHFLEDGLRGKFGGLTLGDYIGIGSGEDAIFSRIGTGGEDKGNFSTRTALLISSSPIDGLFIGLKLNGYIFDNWGSEEFPITYTANSFRYMQLAAGYNIANIGHIRAQYLGGWFGEIDRNDEDTAKYLAASNDKPARIEAAFALTAIDGLLIDLGGKFYFPQKFKGTGEERTDGAAFSLAAKFNAGIFGIFFRSDLTGLGAYNRVNNSDKSAEAMKMAFVLEPTFGFDFGTVGFDVGFAVNGESKDTSGNGKEDNTTQLGFGAFFEKNLGKGNINVGLVYKLPANGKNGANGSGFFEVPISIVASFF